MTSLVKQQLRSRTPRTYALLREIFNPWVRLTCQIGRRQGWLVATGPFAGMRYLDNAHGSRLIPKLLGSYEAELHGVIQHLITRAPLMVIDVGCAEGYYAVGFARALPMAKVIAFDISDTARNLCERLAEINGVRTRVAIEAKCDSETLNRLPLEQALLIVDCEGFELDLLQPCRAPGLAKATILVELHDCFVPGLSQELLPRFKDSHTLRLIPLQERDPENYASLRGLRRQEKLRAVDEDRRRNNQPLWQQWALLEPLYKGVTR